MNIGKLRVNDILRQRRTGEQKDNLLTIVEVQERHIRVRGDSGITWNLRIDDLKCYDHILCGGK